ncbi:MAG: nuclear transport factor 2 family protein [Myxococcota bacterium]|nr:nuclear transport factor 2 family protein [Myxococcota bacterium]
MSREVIEKYLASWQTHDQEAWLSLFAETAVLNDPAGTPPHRGKDAIRSFWNQVHLPFNYEPKIHKFVEAGNEILCHFTMESRGPDGAGMAIDIIDIFTFNTEDQIVELKAFWDQRCVKPILS